MLKTLKSLNGKVVAIKDDDFGTDIQFSACENNAPYLVEDKSKVAASFKIKNALGFLKSVNAGIANGGYVFNLNSKDLVELTPDDYQIELWITEDDKTKIYPDDGFVNLKITENAMMIKGDVVPTITLDDFKKEIKEYINSLGVGDDSNGVSSEVVQTLQKNIETNASDIQANKTKIETNTSDIAKNKATDLTQNQQLMAGQQMMLMLQQQMQGIAHNSISGSADLNSYNHNKTYEILGASLSNSPIPSTWGILHNIAFNSGSNGIQVLIDTGGNKVYWRTWQSYNSFNQWNTL